MSEDLMIKVVMISFIVIVIIVSFGYLIFQEIKSHRINRVIGISKGAIKLIPVFYRI